MKIENKPTKVLTPVANRKIAADIIGDAFKEFLNQKAPILSIRVISRYDVDPSFGKMYISK